MDIVPDIVDMVTDIEDDVFISKIEIVSSERIDIKKFAENVSSFGTLVSVSSRYIWQDED